MHGLVDVHVVELARVQPRLDDLDARERARSERLRVELKRHQFLAAQTALRAVLADRLGLRPAAVEFGYGEHGKPFLPGHPGIGFNLSHSADLALVAVADATELGVDLEFIGRDRPFLRLARRYFAPSEHAWLTAQPERRHRAAFYRTWVLKEAYLKAVGTGLTVSPSAFTLDLSIAPATMASTTLPGRGPGDWTFAEVEVDDRYAAALCAAGRIDRVAIHRR